MGPFISLMNSARVEKYFCPDLLQFLSHTEAKLNRFMRYYSYMPRPRKYRRIDRSFTPPVDLFHPSESQGSERIFITRDELEALRLRYYETNEDGSRLTQVEAAKRMGISQTTFSRIINSAFEKVTKALVEGKAIQILSSGVSWGTRGRPAAMARMADGEAVESVLIFDGFGCLDCGNHFSPDNIKEYDKDPKKKPECPNCHSTRVYRLKKKGPPI